MFYSAYTYFQPIICGTSAPVVLFCLLGDNDSIRLMQKKMVKKRVIVVLLALVLATSGWVSSVSAETSSSPNYQVTESQFGGTTGSDSCSGQYCAQVSIGDPAIGSATAGQSRAEFGAITGSDPLLEVIVEPGESNLGVVTTQTTATKTSIVRVRNYLSSGYIVQVVGSPPSYSGHTLAAPSSPTTSVAGQEQFGLNVVANSSPNVGTNPVQVPSSQISFGVVAANYNQANHFMYQSEDTIARSDSASGQTDYTISMIINISNGTPAGRYNSDFSVIVTPIY